jgi:hypothetical protein
VPLTIARQSFDAQCPYCLQVYAGVRGPVFDGDEGVGLYLAGMHRCEGGAGSVVMTIAFRQGETSEAYTVQAWSNGDETQMVFLDGAESPWASESYLGRMLSAAESRDSDRRDAVFEVAGLICGTIPEVVAFLDQTASA